MTFKMGEESAMLHQRGYRGVTFLDPAGSSAFKDPRI